MDLQSPPPITTVRRNPPRRAKQTPSTSYAPHSATSSAAAAATAIALVPFDHLLQPDAFKIPPPPTNPASSGPETLNVFLRIRPLEIRPKPDKNLKPRAKAKAKAKTAPLSPKGKGGKSKKSGSSSSNVCLVVNDSNSVTLSAPPSVFDSRKRTRSELYDGFSFVFPQDSVQEEIYERVMNPLVMDFMTGKSSLLAAMGPTGSGKTHTMFGSAREPGVVPLALRHIFSQSKEIKNHTQSRSYYLSMFEIYSERGNVERIFDLSPDGVDVSFQQSTIKGLKEIKISDATEAESLVACGFLKRATAATSANDQSSRSQCLINIRCTLEISNDENEFSSHSAVLTIADLAGAEREKKTGNQGARFMESNFINNTSMVFGLCLRSLLEHQKNPKRSLEKHFKNSLLTRYLKDYLEGKKRMTLILTVKPGEDDFLDTSFLLRQASPYMKIKFNNIDDVPMVSCQKRNTTSSFRPENCKRKKLNDAESELVDHGKKDSEIPGQCQTFENEAKCEKNHELKRRQMSVISSESVKVVHVGSTSTKDLQVQLTRMNRNEEVMRKFSMALWSVLKQYRDKLQNSENEVRGLKEALGKEMKKVHKLEEELQELKSQYSCSKHTSTEKGFQDKADSPSALTITSNPVDFKKTDEELNNLAQTIVEISPEVGCVHEHSKSLSNDSEGTPTESVLAEASCEDESSGLSSSVLQYTTNDCLAVGKSSILKNDGKLEIFNAGNMSSILEALNGLSNESVEDCPNDSGNGNCCDDLVVVDSPRIAESFGRKFRGMNLAGTECAAISVTSDMMENYTSISSSSDRCSALLVEKADVPNAVCSMPFVEDTKMQNYKDQDNFQRLEHKPEDVEKDSSEYASSTGKPSNPFVHSSNFDGLQVDENDILHERKLDIKEIKPQPNLSFVEDIKDNDSDSGLLKNQKHTSSMKPKRRLLPKSAMMLQEFSLDMEAENLKENISNLNTEGRGRPQGNISLVHLIKGQY